MKKPRNYWPAHINFIVPRHGLLRKLQPIGAELPSTRPSGIIQDVLSALQQNANPSVCYNLQYDGKLMKQGLTQSHGDIDCLGEENGTTLWQNSTSNMYVKFQNSDSVISLQDSAVCNMDATGTRFSSSTSPWLCVGTMKLM